DSIRWRLGVGEAFAQGAKDVLLKAADPAGFRRPAVLLRTYPRPARRRSTHLAQYRCLATRLGFGADRAHRLDLPRHLVGGNPGSTGLGGAAQGGRGDLRDLRDGLAAVGVADRVA